MRRLASFARANGCGGIVGTRVGRLAGIGWIRACRDGRSKQASARMGQSTQLRQGCLFSERSAAFRISVGLRGTDRQRDCAFDGSRKQTIVVTKKPVTNRASPFVFDVLRLCANLAHQGILLFPFPRSFFRQSCGRLGHRLLCTWERWRAATPDPDTASALGFGSVAVFPMAASREAVHCLGPPEERRLEGSEGIPETLTDWTIFPRRFGAFALSRSVWLFRRHS